MATVNGQQISRDDLGYACLVRYGKDILETMINKQLILNACKQHGVVVTHQDIDTEIQIFARRFGHNAEQWLKMLKRERGISTDRYKRDIIWPMVALRKLVADEIQVSQEEIDRMLVSEFGPRVQVRMIACKTRKKAEWLLQKAVANPSDFGHLAKEHSADEKSASVRGIIPPLRRGAAPPEIEHVAFALRVEEVSPVIEVGGQFLLLQCVKHFPPPAVNDQVRKLAQKKVIEQIRQDKLKTAANKLLQDMLKRVPVVNVHHNAELKQKMPGVAATVGEAQITIRQLAEECITRHGYDVLEGEINRKVLKQELQRRNTNVEPADIDYEIARAAEANNFMKDGNPDINGWLRSIVERDEISVDVYVQDAVWPSVALKKLVTDSIKVTEEDLQKGYISNFGARVEVLAVVVDDQRTAQQVWEFARRDPRDEHFGELAYRYSTDSMSRHNYGRVSPIQKYGGRPTLEKEAFALKDGETSGLIAVGNRWIILRCLGRTKPIVTDFAAVRDDLYKDIFEKKLRLAMAREFDRLRESAQIDNFITGTTQSGARYADRRIRQRLPFRPTSFATPDSNVQPNRLR
ncbi:MAG: peptidylprolyl isomerase [Planctomycetes bacterium]|nr:peptidylprolyl isomerase [Planctomycetota bacterium]